MDRRAHFLLRAAAIAVLLVEAVYPHHASLSASTSGAAPTVATTLTAPIVATASTPVAPSVSSPTAVATR